MAADHASGRRASRPVAVLREFSRPRRRAAGSRRPVGRRGGACGHPPAGARASPRAFPGRGPAARLRLRPPMNEILAVGLILAVALAAGRLAHRFGLPEVTAYLLVGILIGPASLDLVTHEAVLTLEFLSEIALGFILFGIGAIFEAETFRRVGRAVVRIVLMETGLTFVLVFTLLLAVGTPIPVALFLGVIAMETAPATTLMVVRE